MSRIAAHVLGLALLVTTAQALAATAVPSGVPLPEAEYDFLHFYRNPYDAASQTYIVSTSNAVLYSEGTVRVWKPNIGGTSLATTTPGVITYHFEFDQAASAIDLWMSMPTFHWSYSRGHNYLRGSTDGTNWTLLAELPPPDFGKARELGRVTIPAGLLGATDLWLRVELFSYGSSAPSGSVFTNTSQLSRYDTGLNNVSFALGVQYVPIPAALPLLASSLGLLGWMTRRRTARR